MFALKPAPKSRPLLPAVILSVVSRFLALPEIAGVRFPFGTRSRKISLRFCRRRPPANPLRRVPFALCAKDGIGSIGVFGEANPINSRTVLPSSRLASYALSHERKSRGMRTYAKTGEGPAVQPAPLTHIAGQFVRISGMGL